MPSRLSHMWERKERVKYKPSPLFSGSLLWGLHIHRWLKGGGGGGRKATLLTLSKVYCRKTWDPTHLCCFWGWWWGREKATEEALLLLRVRKKKRPQQVWAHQAEFRILPRSRKDLGAISDLWQITSLWCSAPGPVKADRGVLPEVPSSTISLWCCNQRWFIFKISLQKIM